MARVARRRNRPRVARWWSHIGFPREMTHTPLQTHFPPARYARARYARRRPTYALCELSDNHCSSERARLRARCRVQSGRQWPSPGRPRAVRESDARSNCCTRRGHDDCATATPYIALFLTRTNFIRDVPRTPFFWRCPGSVSSRGSSHTQGQPA